MFLTRGYITEIMFSPMTFVNARDYKTHYQATWNEFTIQYEQTKHLHSAEPLLFYVVSQCGQMLES